MDKFNRIHSLQKELKVDIIALIETRVIDSRIKCFCSIFPNRWNWAAIIADGYSGRIIILWLRKIGIISPIVHSRYALHLIISLTSENQCILCVVYNI